MSISSGAVFHENIYRVSNVLQAIRMLKEKGVWVVATDLDGEENYFDVDYKTHPFAFVMGNEGEGVRKAF